MNSPASAISTESLQSGSLPEGVVPPAPHASMPTFGLLVLGDELLSGRRADKHVPKAIELLGARGLALSYVHMIGDDRARIADQLRRSFASGDVVFSCGGIGATPDDHTRQAAAEALGVPLAMHPAARAQILARMRDVASEKGEPFDEERADNLQRLQMAMFPEGASIIPNPYNRIAGFSVGHVHFMPGFPVMAWPMMEWVLDTFYAHWFERRHWVERSIIVRKAYEAALGQGEVFFFGQRHNRVNGNYGTARTLMGVLPKALREAQSPQDLLQRLNDGGVFFVDAGICSALFKNKSTFPQLEERLKKIQEDEALEAERRKRASR